MVRPSYPHRVSSPDLAPSAVPYHFSYLSGAPGYYVGMGYVITNLSFNLLVTEFFLTICLTLRTFGEVTCKMVDCVICPYALYFYPQRCRTHQISKNYVCLKVKTVTNCCYANRQINASLLSYYQQISNSYRSVLTY